VIEMKTAMRYDKWGEPGTNQVPIYYRCQALWLCDVTGARRVILPVLHGLFDYREYVIDLDREPDADEEIALMVNRGQRFVDALINGPTPEPDDGSAITLDVVKKLHPKIDPELDAAIDPALAGEWMVAKDTKEAAEKDLDRATARILAAAGDAKHLYAGDDLHRFAYRSSRSRTVDGVKMPGDPFLVADAQATSWTTIKEAVRA